jgi:sensor histidine kinase YesM
MSTAAGLRPGFFGIFIQVTFWLVLFSSSIVFCLYILPWQQALYRSLLIIGCHAINFYAFYYWIVPVLYKNGKYFQGLVATVLFISVLTPVRLLVANLFVLSEILVIQVDLPGRLVFIIFTEITIAGFGTFMRLASDQENSSRRVVALEKLNLESELRFLKAQMNPHFLFNTINNIYSLTLLKSDKAPESIMRLSGLLRYLLYESGERVKLDKEVSALRAYADLFALKYEETLDLTIDVSAHNETLIEPLILIPVLENALKHSGLGIDRNAFVKFKVYQDSATLCIECSNSKSILPATIESGGIGLANIRKRLEMTYADKYDLSLTETGNVYCLTLKLSFS